MTAKGVPYSSFCPRLNRELLQGSVCTPFRDAADGIDTATFGTMRVPELRFSIGSIASSRHLIAKTCYRECSACTASTMVQEK